MKQRMMKEVVKELKERQHFQGKKRRIKVTSYSVQYPFLGGLRFLLLFMKY